MSLTAESPVHSSSSGEDFAAMLEAELKLKSSLSSSQNKVSCQEEGVDYGQEEDGGIANEVAEEKGLKGINWKMLEGDSRRSLFRLGSTHLLTKLRPFGHSFLSEASSMYEMYIYTMGDRSYALEIAKILDPDEVYFKSKVICQSDCTKKHQKGLDVVLSAESSVVILDDTETVT